MRITKLLSTFTGLLFLVSGLAKATDCLSFATLIGEYGGSWLGIFAPIIIVIEIILSMLLLFEYFPRITAAVSFFFILFLSIAFAYGNIFLSITDCGCFGPIPWLKMTPTFTFLRNAVLLVIFTLLYTKPLEKKNPNIATIVFMCIIISITTFMCGISMQGYRINETSNTQDPIPFNKSELNSVISINNDSTYLVFAFSYNCPYCLSSIENVNQYSQMGVVDKVIGIALRDDEAKKHFDKLFHPEFEIVEVNSWTMRKIATTLPTSYHIQHDTILNIGTGIVPSAAIYIP